MNLTQTVNLVNGLPTLHNPMTGIGKSYSNFIVLYKEFDKFE